MAVLKTIELPIEIEEVDLTGMMECGFQQNWISGENNDFSFELDSGAGCGSAWVQFTVEKHDGSLKRMFRYDMRKFVVEFLKTICQAN